MGCDQSKVNNKAALPLSPSRMDRIITIESEQKQKGIDSTERHGRNQAQSNNNSRKPTPNPYQGVQSPVLNMDPREFEDALAEYKECDEAIRLLEREDPLTLFYIKKSHLQNILEAMDMTTTKIKGMQRAMQTEQEAEEEDGEVQNLRKVVVEYGGKDVVSKAEQEYLTSMNRLEIAATELEMLQQEKALAESEVSAFKSICKKLIALYNRQDDIAKKLTVEGTSNAEEAKLYANLAEVETKKIKISEAFQRWREARSQIIDACRQFGVALKKWREIKDDTPAKLFDMTEEIRDDLVTSLQCITNARFYIRLFELPYCSKAEMAVLEKALSFIFIDMNSAERRLHADSCYKAFHNRAVALFAWTDMTIKQVIQPESSRVRGELLAVTKQARDVRFRTIQKQFPGVSWKVTEDRVDEIDVGNSALTDPESLETFKNLDTGQLAQPPSIDEIYGKSTTGSNYKTLFFDNLTPETQSLVENGEVQQGEPMYANGVIKSHNDLKQPNGSLLK